MFALQGRVFKVGELTKAVLAMCGGHYNAFFFEAQRRPLAEVLYLFETWLEFHQDAKAKEKRY